MILMLFLYDPLYASSHDLESDYPWSGLKDENYTISDIIKLGLRSTLTCLSEHQYSADPAWLSC